LHEHPLTHRSKTLRYDGAETRLPVAMLRKAPNWREKAALNAFDGEDVLRFADLPRNVGRRTMDRLVARGLVEPVDCDIGRFSADYGWMRVRD
jgi:hypothetical protein